MATFFIAGKSIDLPAVPLYPKATSRQRDAWLFGQFMTVRLLASVHGIRVHTNGRAFAGRERSESVGAWVALGDVIQTASELRDTRALPGVFTHVGDVTLPEQCVINVGVCSPLFGGDGGGLQAEYVSGPPLKFEQLAGKHWHASAGNA